MDYKKAVEELKRERKAIVLAHNYQVQEVQEVADFVGDSLELARLSAEVDAKLIVFAGVYFMAETAKILNPQKVVLIPERDARCPMADMVDAPKVRELRAKYPDAAFVAYVNTNADVKAEVDVVCTSANAVRVVNSLPHQRVVFLPDQNLAHWVSLNTQKEVIPYPGYCYVHKNFAPEAVERLKRENPDAEVIVHPEARPEVVKMADRVFSTYGMIKYVGESPSRKFIVVTEEGLLERLRKLYPQKQILSPGMKGICVDMKKISLRSVYLSLKELKYEVKVPEEIAEKAKRAIDKMLEIT